MNSDKPLVYIAGDFSGSVIGMFYAAGWRGTNDLMMADLVCFTGGADINPALYGQEPIRECGAPNLKRDAAEVDVFNQARNFQIPMVGICRGAQLLNVLNDGALWQHVDNHTSSHWLADVRTGERVYVTSTHHQMMQPAQGGELVAIACPQKDDDKQEPKGSLCTVKKSEGLQVKPKDKDYDTEVVWYAKTKSLCFQPHPEYNPKGTGTHDYFFNLVSEFITDVEQEKAA